MAVADGGPRKAEFSCHDHVKLAQLFSPTLHSVQHRVSAAGFEMAHRADFNI